jgi:hypothetical protein
VVSSFSKSINTAALSLVNKFRNFSIIVPICWSDEDYPWFRRLVFRLSFILHITLKQVRLIQRPYKSCNIHYWYLWNSYLRILSIMWNQFFSTSHN